MTDQPAADEALLGPAEIRELAAGLDIRPTKQWGQNFVIDKGTVRKIVPRPARRALPLSRRAEGGHRDQ